MMPCTTVPVTEDHLPDKILVVGAPILIMDDPVQLSVSVAISATTLVIFPVCVAKDQIAIHLDNNFYQSRTETIILALLQNLVF